MSESVTVKRVVLHADCQTVFWDLLEPSHVPSYDSRMRRWQPSEFPPTVGTTADFEMKMAGVWMRGRSRFTEFDPPHRLALVQVRPPSPFGFEVEWTLTPHPPGCVFEYRFRASSPLGLGWLGGVLLRTVTSHLEVEIPALATRYR
ncbi:MAG: SRPBCC domain-containing protein [Acidimicrobiia bacterium]